MKKRLYRSDENRMIAGVCGGIAEYFSIDPTIVRVGFALLLLPGGIPGLLIYILMWVIVPKKLKKRCLALFDHQLEVR